VDPSLLSAPDAPCRSRTTEKPDTSERTRDSERGGRSSESHSSMFELPRSDRCSLACSLTSMGGPGVLVFTTADLRKHLWSYGESNSRPLPCHGSALPTEL
jgi:hypothetical protein